MPDLVEITDGKLRLNLHLGQTRAWDSQARFVFIVAGSQSGKTSIGPVILWKWINEMGPGDYLAVTATYDLFKLKMLPETLRFFCERLKWGKYSASDRVIVSNDGDTRIILRSANSPGGLESSSVKAAWLDECGMDTFTLDAWEAIQRRLSLAQGRVLGTTTPYNLGWLKCEIYDRYAAGDPDYDVIQFRSIDNPAFPVAEYERMRATLPPWKFEMFYNGAFARPGGLIYEDFNTELHRINLPYIPPFWPIYVGVDFGAVHTAQVWLAEEPGTHRLYVFRETLTGGRSTPEHAQLAKINAAPFRYVKWYGGAAGEDQQRMDWQRAGIPLQRPPVTDVEAQIDRVIGLFRQNRLFIGKGLAGLVNELTTYSREIDAQGHPTEKIANKAAFHRLDALRYVVAGLTRSQTRARSSEY